MLAFILFLVFGPRIAVAELMGELAVGVILLAGSGGGGGGRRLRWLRDVLPRPVRLLGSPAS
jgi:hypothetical protein